MRETAASKPKSTRERYSPRTTKNIAQWSPSELVIRENSVNPFSPRPTKVGETQNHQLLRSWNGVCHSTGENSAGASIHPPTLSTLTSVEDVSIAADIFQATHLDGERAGNCLAGLGPSLRSVEPIFNPPETPESDGPPYGGDGGAETFAAGVGVQAAGAAAQAVGREAGGSSVSRPRSMFDDSECRAPTPGSAAVVPAAAVGGVSELLLRFWM